MTFQWKMGSAVARRVAFSSAKLPVAGLLSKRFIAGNGIHSAQFRTLSHLVNVYRSTPSVVSTRTYATTKSKPATKKPAEAGKKSAGKTKAAATKKQKKAAPKKAARRGGKKPLTERQQLLQKKADARETYRKLKEQALTPPKKLPYNPIQVFIRENEISLSQALERYKDLSETEHQVSALVYCPALRSEQPTLTRSQHLREVAQKNRAINAKKREEWVKSFSPNQIRLANIARQRLSLIRKRQIARFADDRAVRRPMSSYMIFRVDLLKHPELKDLPITEASKRLSKMWKDSSESVKQVRF